MAVPNVDDAAATKQTGIDEGSFSANGQSAMDRLMGVMNWLYWISH